MLPLTLLLAAPVSMEGQAQETVNVTAIELVAEVKGKDGTAPRDLTPADFTVREDGVERRVIGVEYLAPPRQAAAAPAEATTVDTAPVPEAAPEPPPLWHFVFYFESELSGAQGRKQVAAAIAAQADDLVRRGKVDIVFATPIPAALVRDSRDPKAIREALRQVGARPGVNQLLMNRQRLRLDMVGRSEPTFNDLRPYLEEDILMLTRFRRNLSRWLSSYRRQAPRMAVIVTDGFDLDPIDFYASNVGAFLTPEGVVMQSELRAFASGLQVGTATADLGKELAGGSWVVSSVPAQMDMGMAVDDASSWGIGRVKSRGPTSKGAKTLVNQPATPLHVLADATGGTVIGNHSRFDEALDQLSRYVRITYQVSRAPDAQIRKVEVTSRRGELAVRAQQWAASATSEETAEARAVSLLSGVVLPGQELPVQAAITLDHSSGRYVGTVTGSARLDVLSELIKEKGRRNMRVTVALLAVPQVHYVSRIVPRANVTTGVFEYELVLDLPGPVTKMVVTVEDLATGAWGSASASPE